MKPTIPKGTRDFGPVEMAKRNYIFNTIREVYALYGFQQIETPAMETLQTLMGKYGEEGDKLLFKVLNSGDCLAKVTDEEPRERNSLHLAAKMCEKGLRYDLTVPFARYVVMHRDELQFPFKRYQYQAVWRADRPQKGRYREFYQFDGDVVGSDSLMNEVELMQIIDTVFTRFGVRVKIKINNRKILTGIAEVIGAADKIVDITVAIDKLDKIGLDNVNAELREDGLSDEQIEKLQPIITLAGTNDEKLATQDAAGCIISFVLAEWSHYYNKTDTMSFDVNFGYQLYEQKNNPVVTELCRIIAEGRFGICPVCDRPFVVKRRPTNGVINKTFCTNSCKVKGFAERRSEEAGE